MDVVHQDRTGSLAAPVSARIYEGRVARIHGQGDPLRYDWGDEYRDAAGLKQIADQLQTTKPFCVLHPADLITKGARADIVGQVIGARVDGDHVIARILVTDSRGDQTIADGMHELSLGYTSRLDETRHQRDIQVDHLALVPRARCGATCALRADCADTAQPCACNIRAMSYATENVADKPIQDAVSPGVPPVAAVVEIPRNAAMDELQTKLIAALTEAAQHKTRADQLEVDLRTAKAALTTAEVAATNAQAELKTATARADQARQDADAAIAKARLDADTAVTAAVATRVQLMTEANQILGAKDASGNPIDRSSMDAQSIQRAVIKHVDGLEFPADKDPIFVAGVYAGSLARASAASVSRSDARTAIQAHRVDGTKAAVITPTSGAADDESRERDAMMNRNKSGK